MGDPKGSQEHQASEALVGYLEKAQSLMPTTKNNKEPAPLLKLIEEALAEARIEEEGCEDSDEDDMQQGPNSLANTGGLPQGRNRTDSMDKATRADLSRTSPAIFTNLP